MMLGRNHDLIRRLRALKRDGGKRRAAGLYLAEGLHLAEEALRNGAAVEFFLISPALRESPAGEALLADMTASGLPVHETSDALLASLQDARSAQPALSVIRRPERTAEMLLADLGPQPLVVVAHAIQDPGNLGSILRSADAAGADAFLACGPGADPYHPRTVRATMGSIFRLPAAEAHVDGVLELLRARGIAAVGADARSSTPYHAAELGGPLALFLGRESGGLPRSLLAALDRTISIPMHHGVESLSVGAAAAVLLFEAARQRGSA